MTTPLLVVQGVSRAFGRTVAVDNVSIEVGDGEFVSLLGPSGCGKTTLLRIIAGFEHPDKGQVFVGGKDITGLPPNRRPTNLLFQRGALFPHMTVRQNIAYSLNRKRMPKAGVEARVREMLELIRLPDFGDRRPSQLSGGEAQRIALARALAADPEVLLLDEPLGALDKKLRKDLQLELRKIHRDLGKTFVFVTHDQEEALVMSDRIVVMDRGRVVQEGTPREIYTRPNSIFSSDFIGETNLLRAVVEDADDRRAHVRVGEIVLSVAPSEQMPPNAMVTLSIRPEDIVAPHDGNGENTLSGVIAEVVFLGNRVSARITSALGCDIWVEKGLEANTPGGLQEEQPISFLLPTNAMRVFHLESEEDAEDDAEEDEET